MSAINGLSPLNKIDMVIIAESIDFFLLHQIAQPSVYHKKGPVQTGPEKDFLFVRSLTAQKKHRRTKIRHSVFYPVI